MSDRNHFEAHPLEPKLRYLGDSIRALANSHEGDSLALLALLRTLEGLHQEIRDSLFQDSLPDNRQALYSLLKDIEASGGWPYIHRMKLQSLLSNFHTMPDEVTAPSFDSLTSVSTADEAID